jgi:hypothetical protein
MTSAAALARALALIFSFSPATREKERKKEFPPGYNNKRFLTRQRRESAPFVCLVYVCNMCLFLLSPRGDCRMKWPRRVPADARYGHSLFFFLKFVYTLPHFSCRVAFFFLFLLNASGGTSAWAISSHSCITLLHSENERRLASSPQVAFFFHF